MKTLFLAALFFVFPTIGCAPTLPIDLLNDEFANYSVLEIQEGDCGQLVFVMLSPDLGDEHPQHIKRLVIDHVNAKDISIIP